MKIRIIKIMLVLLTAPVLMLPLLPAAAPGGAADHTCRDNRHHACRRDYRDHTGRDHRDQ